MRTETHEEYLEVLCEMMVDEPRQDVKEIETVLEGSMFTKDEDEIFDLNLQYRQLMLEKLFEDDVGPEDNSTRRIANELITSVDTALLSKAKLRHSMKVTEDIVESNVDMRAILFGIAKERALLKQETIRELPSEYIPTDIVPGLDVKGQDLVDPNDFFEE